MIYKYLHLHVYCIYIYIYIIYMSLYNVYYHIVGSGTSDVSGGHFHVDRIQRERGECECVSV